MPEEGNGKYPDALRPPVPGRGEAIGVPAGAPAARSMSRKTRPSTPARCDLRSEGESVFAELARASLDATASAPPEPPPPARQRRIERLVEELAEAGPPGDGPLFEQLLRFGPEALPALEKAFPGALWVDLSRPHRPLKSAHQLSALAGAMVVFGDDSIPCVARLLRATRPEVRVSAALVATDLAHGDLVWPLAARLEDDVPLVRQAVMVALRAAAHLPEARLLRSRLLETLEERKNETGWRKKAAWTLGQLRETEPVPRLIEQLGDTQVADIVRQALVLLIGKDIGRFRFRWRRWWKSNRDRDRADWLIDALDQSDAARRARVATELVLLAGRRLGEPDAVTTRRRARELGERYRALLAKRDD